MNYSNSNLQFQLAMDAQCFLNGLKSWENYHYPMSITYEEENSLIYVAAYIPLEDRSIKAFNCIIALN